MSQITVFGAGPARGSNSSSNIYYKTFGTGGAIDKCHSHRHSKRGPGGTSDPLSVSGQFAARIEICLCLCRHLVGFTADRKAWFLWALLARRSLFLPPGPTKSFLCVWLHEWRGAGQLGLGWRDVCAPVPKSLDACSPPWRITMSRGCGERPEGRGDDL